MKQHAESRRQFLKATGLAAGALLLPSGAAAMESGDTTGSVSRALSDESGAADYTIRIAVTPIELAPDRIISTVTYNGQFPGPLLRFKERQPVTIDIINNTDVPEQLCDSVNVRALHPQSGL